MEFDAPVYDQIHLEQNVAGEMTLNIVENPVAQEQVIVQENSELQVMEWIQEQIVETTKEVTRERVQQHTVEQIVQVPVHQRQEQVIVQEVPQAVDSFPPLTEFVAPMCNHILHEQIVATIQPHARFQERSEVQVVERIPEQIVETIKVVSQECVTQRTSEQFEVQMNTISTSTSEQTVDIPILRGVGEIGDMSVQLATKAINEVHALAQTKQRKGGQPRGGVLESSLKVTGIDQVVSVPTRCTTSAK